MRIFRSINNAISHLEECYKGGERQFDSKFNLDQSKRHVSIRPVVLFCPDKNLILHGTCTEKLAKTEYLIVRLI